MLNACSESARLERLEPRRHLASDVPVVDATINPSQTFQTWDGFGGSMVAFENRAAYNDPAFFNALVTDMGANMVRLPVWHAFEQRNDDDNPNHINWDGFDTDTALAPTMRFAQEIQKRAGDDFKTLATIWTPPWWMKTTGAHNFGGFLRADMRDEFAEYVTAYVLSAERDWGIHIDAISIQNEPHFIEPYESTLYTPEQLALAMKAVGERFAQEGITDTKIVVHEDLPVNDRWGWWEDLIVDDPEIDELNYMWGTHWAPEAVYPHQRATVRETGRKLWLTEAAGKDSDTWLAGLRTSEDIAGMMNEADVSAFFEWQYDGGTDNSRSSSWYQGQPTNRYQVMKHYARWIRPGAVRQGISYTNHDIDDNEQRDVWVTSWKNEDDSRAIVVTNNYTTPVTFNINPGGSSAWRAWRSTGAAKFESITPAVSSDGTIQLTLPARSIATLYNGGETPASGVASTSVRGDQRIIYPADSASHSLRGDALGSYLTPLTQKVNDGADIDAAFVNGRDALFLAAASPNPYNDDLYVQQVMNLLIDNGADVNRQDVEGITPLMVAASTPVLWWTNDPANSVAKLSTLVGRGADIHIKDDMGRTALHWAAQSTRWLFKSGQPHDASFLIYLLEQGADKNKVDRFGMTPLMWAEQEGATGNVAALAAWSQDTAAPEVLQGGLELGNSAVATVDFDEAMGPLAAGGFEIRRQDDEGNLGSNVAFSLSSVTLAAGNTQARLMLNSPLENGYYVAISKAGGSRDKAGNAITSLDSSQFWFLNADANRDKIVDIYDFLALRKNFGKTGAGFTGGDFNFDGRVDLADFGILRSNYGQALGVEPQEPDGDPLPGGNPPAATSAGMVAVSGSGRSASGVFSQRPVEPGNGRITASLARLTGGRGSVIDADSEMDSLRR